MTRVLQPAGTHLCGQAVVAMIAGITIEEAIARCGTRGRTRTAQLVRAFDSLGLRVEKRMLRPGQPPGRSSWHRGFGMVRDRPRRGGRSTSWRHWYAFDGGRVFDSWYERAPKDWPERWHVTREYAVVPISGAAPGREG